MMDKKTLKIWLIVVGVLLIGAAILAFVRTRENNSPQRVVGKVLDLRSQLPQKQKQLESYMTAELIKQPKKSEFKAKTTVYSLSSRRDGKNTIVTMNLDLVDGKGPYKAPVADFYLERSGTFAHKWIIFNIIELDPILSDTIGNIVPKKEASEVKLGESFELEKDLKVMATNFKKNKPEVIIDEELTAYTLDLIAVNKPGEIPAQGGSASGGKNKEIVISGLDGKGNLCVPTSKIKLDFDKENKIPVTLNALGGMCTPEKLKIESSALDKDFIILLGGEN